MVEIGSIFEIDERSLFFNAGSSLPKLPIESSTGYFAYYFNTGRAAIEALLMKLKAEGYRDLLLPSFLCDSVRDAAIRAGMNLEYYRVNRDLSVDTLTVNVRKNVIIYVVQFFGQRINDELISLVRETKNQRIIIIEDISLSLLSEAGEYVGFGDYIVGSLRKWFPIIDGGILLSRIEVKFEQHEAANDYSLNYFIAQILKNHYLLSGEKNKGQKDIFLSYNNDGMEALFSDYTIRKMTRVSQDLLRGANFDTIRARRINNYDLLKVLLADIPQVTVLVDRHENMTPLGMVILVEERDELLSHLISRDIYCNVHWRNNESTKYFNESEYLANRCITIPCDQRYGEKEMHYIYESVKDYYKR